ncbi:MAG TPA: phenylalanine--tRNA ligase subunit alpha [Bacteroidales bacterium]|nr:phenylalanine--tRNA ligase subunit alpha [Bacteroidales bacterium]HRZ76232.1 phenylalanine--tRNA ligase subunit alpha [Bacteroidales bacterium]
MKDKVAGYLGEIAAVRIDSHEALEAYRLKYLSRKGVVQQLFAEFKTVAPEQRREMGVLLNELKEKAQERFDALKEALERSAQPSGPATDFSRPAIQHPLGSRHPIAIVRNQVDEIFTRLGFVVSEGPEIEDDWHNFSALNFAPEHPARDMQDTFFIHRDPEVLLRTHTSSVQVRVMSSQAPPIRTISPGRVFRNEAISARAHVIFHQVEGLYIDKGVSFADLRQTLLYFAREMFGEETRIRLRPSYFPFTEPSAEMDISCSCKGAGCRICKYTGWVEILGCGMVDPAVLANCGIDPEVYSGYAFGMGIERMTLVKYNVNDLRLFFENDIRFLRQFTGVS